MEDLYLYGIWRIPAVVKKDQVIFKKDDELFLKGRRLF